MTTTTPVNAIPSPDATGDGKDVVQHFLNQANQIDTRLVSRYATDSARNAANPTPINGQLVHSNDKNKLSIRRNSAWENILTPVTVIKWTNEALTSNTNLQNDDELFFYGEANALYIVECALGVGGGLDTGALAGIKYGFSFPAGATIQRFFFQELDHGAGAVRNDGLMEIGSNNLSAFISGSLWSNAGTSTGSNSNFFSFQITTGSTPGNIQLMWAQSVSNATPVTVSAHSFLTYTRIS